MSALTRSLLLAALTLLACERSANASYRTRGLVRGVDGAGDELAIAIHHERITRFVDRDGRASPMPAMAMMFGLAPALAERAVRPGDKVAFTFEVRWDERPTLLITQLEPLSPTTELALGGTH